MGMLRSGFKTPSTFQNTKSSCQLVIQIILKKVNQLACLPVNFQKYFFVPTGERVTGKPENPNY
jgi:hypothetical protein